MTWPELTKALESMLYDHVQCANTARNGFHTLENTYSKISMKQGSEMQGSKMRCHGLFNDQMDPSMRSKGVSRDWAYHMDPQRLSMLDLIPPAVADIGIPQV